jgi:hypothetical protein
MSCESRPNAMAPSTDFENRGSTASDALSGCKVEIRGAGSPLTGKLQGVIPMLSCPLQTVMRLPTERMSEEQRESARHSVNTSDSLISADLVDSSKPRWPRPGEEPLPKIAIAMWPLR